MRIVSQGQGPDKGVNLSHLNPFSSGTTEVDKFQFYFDFTTYFELNFTCDYTLHIYASITNSLSAILFRCNLLRCASLEVHILITHSLTEGSIYMSLKLILIFHHTGGIRH